MMRSGKWNLFRMVRLLLGVAVIVQGLADQEYLLSLAGSVLAAMAFFNVGCCSASGCALPAQERKRSHKVAEEYEKEAAS